MTPTPLAAWVEGIGFLAPGLPDWPTARAVLRGEDLGDFRDGLLREEHRAQHRLLGFQAVRRQVVVAVKSLDYGTHPHCPS